MPGPNDKCKAGGCQGNCKCGGDCKCSDNAAEKCGCKAGGDCKCQDCSCS